MKIGFHSAATSAALKGGAIRYYDEVSRILHDQTKNGRFATQALAVLKDPKAYKEKLEFCEIIVSNAGPFAFWRHYIREILGLGFAIFRDVRTTGLSAYLLQEHLCIPLTREVDRIIFPSHYAWHFYVRVFGAKAYYDNSTVRYPLTEFFPAINFANQNHNKNAVGVIGRLNSDKNLEDCLKIYAGLQRVRPKFKLILAGPFESSGPLFPDFGSLLRFSKRTGIDSRGIEYLGKVSYDKIWQSFQRIDVLLFPALSSIESMGRVFIEAAHSRVKVLSADYAAASEFLPASNLITPRYRMNERFSSNKPFSCGSINCEEATGRILNLQLRNQLATALFMEGQGIVSIILAIFLVCFGHIVMSYKFFQWAVTRVKCTGSLVHT